MTSNLRPGAPRRFPTVASRWRAVAVVATSVGSSVSLPGQARWVEVDAFPRQVSAAAAYDEARGRTILFGGLGYARALDRTWEFDGRSWRRLEPPASPSARTAHGMAYDTGRQRIVLFGGQSWDGSHYVNSNETWEWDGATWTRRMPTGPSPAERARTGLAYDPSRQRTVLFGGGNGFSLFADTWEWDGNAWELRSTAGPDAVAGHGMAWDPVTQRILLIGGLGQRGLLERTWSWDGRTWTSVATAVSPAPAWFCHLVTDPLRNRVVFFGGNHTDRIFEWDGSRWTAHPVACSALGRRDGTAVFHPPQALYVGGGDGTTPSGDTWSWDGSRCQKLVDDATPPGSGYAAMAFDRERGETVLFGGMAAQVDRTWLFDGGRWSARRPPVSPPERYLHAMVFDEERQRVLLFGGSAISSAVVRRADTWEWDGAVWSQRRPATAPAARGGHGMVYDRARKQVVLFGGYDSGGAFFGDTWTWDGAEWTRRQPAGTPPARICRMAYDSARQRTVLFGGYGSAGQLTDTWEWDGTTWSQRQPAHTPRLLDQVYWLASLHYDEARQRTVLLGVGSANVMETWEWDGVDWRRRQGPQSPWRSRHTAAYDATRERGLVFGEYDDTWMHFSERPASYAAFGSGCGGSAGVPRLDAGRPWLGGPFTIAVDGLPSAATALCLALGTSRQSWHGLRLPASLGPIGMPGCSLLVSMDLVLGGVAAGGRSRTTFQLCGCPALAGLDFFNQAFVPDPGANTLGVVASNGGAGRLGLR